MPRYTFQINASRSPHALPRILLTFARRRLTVASLNARSGPRMTAVQLSCDCEPFGADQLLAQLQRMVEVEQATLELEVLGESA